MPSYKKKYVSKNEQIEIRNVGTFWRGRSFLANIHSNTCKLNAFYDILSQENFQTFVGVRTVIKLCFRDFEVDLPLLTG